MSMVYVASATILVSRFVKSSGVGTVAQQGTAGDPCVGISQDGGRYAPVPSNTADPVEAAQSGETLDVIAPGEQRDATLLLGTGGATVGGHLMSDASGRGVAVTTGKHACAIALETGVAGEVIRVRPILYQMP
jgi:hypothetical protein